MSAVTAELHTDSHEKRVLDLAESVYRHPALNNAFYDLWRSTELPAAKVEIVARNFFAQVAPTVNRLALVFLRMSPDDLVARSETVENLNDEMGNGDPKKVHTVLLKNFFSVLLSRIQGHEVEFDDIDPTVLPATQRVVDEGAKLFGHENVKVGCGALLAQEWHAYAQLVYLYEGSRNYMRHFALEEFHEHCEFFYLHIGAAEKEHKLHAVSSSAALCKTEEDLEALEFGFTSYLDLLADFWQELAVAAAPGSEA
ncbi:iron-containing redox enzyme family protein [Streptomyces xanthochromogenes]|uniref:iron-containing redox enzyme family protein n=1 Tax=Streptomyces xanthochromogenes TaxID=67384 RepID=UPI002F404185